ncbi:unnamed protein product [Hymenolepis diminuta]|uniref:Uncharacterized protein n=1 Tax=Hymenolepis diminuta TaxID=6216 RepID=A0A564YZ60_HYMDI|nr:unnamed protein product [Hymenolepis diminuta]
MSKCVHQFPLFSVTASLHIKRYIYPHALAWPYPSDSYKATLVLPVNTHWSVRTPTRPVHLLSSSARCSPSLPLSLLLIVVSLSTFLVYSILGVLLHNCVSSYSNSYELVVVIS